MLNAAPKASYLASKICAKGYSTLALLFLKDDFLISVVDLLLAVNYHKFLNFRIDQIAILIIYISSEIMGEF